MGLSLCINFNIYSAVGFWTATTSRLSSSHSEAHSGRGLCHVQIVLPSFVLGIWSFSRFPVHSSAPRFSCPCSCLPFPDARQSISWIWQERIEACSCSNCSTFSSALARSRQYKTVSANLFCFKLSQFSFSWWYLDALKQHDYSIIWLIKRIFYMVHTAKSSLPKHNREYTLDMLAACIFNQYVLIPAITQDTIWK